jgi:hypothetical protein
MRKRSAPKIYVNFSSRVDVETHERRRRLEDASGLTTSQMLEVVYRTFEDAVLRGFSAAEREAYTAGNHDACHAAISRHLTSAAASTPEVGVSTA